MRPRRGLLSIHAQPFSRVAEKCVDPASHVIEHVSKRILEHRGEPPVGRKGIGTAYSLAERRRITAIPHSAPPTSNIVAGSGTKLCEKVSLTEDSVAAPPTTAPAVTTMSFNTVTDPVGDNMVSARFSA